jgi:phosphate transport system substrate-binding protein
VIIAGCEENGAAEAHKAAGAEDVDDACMALRTDGVSIDIDGDYTETLARVDANKNGIGVFGLSFYQNNTDKIQRWHYGRCCSFG